MDQQVPGVNELREHASQTLEASPDIAFGVLFPGLEDRRNDPISEVLVSQRLINVLTRWRGEIWGPYLTETPASLIKRRNCGLRSLGEFLWVARAAAESPSVLPGMLSTTNFDVAERSTEKLEKPEDRADTSKSESLEWAFATIASWAFFERGRTTVRAALDLAYSDASPPEGVRAALQAIDLVDIARWTGGMSYSFDVHRRLDEIALTLTQRDRDILGRRTLMLGRPDTLNMAGTVHGVTRERLRQLQIKAEKHLRSQIGSSTRSPVRRLAERLRSDIGLAIQSEHLPSVETLRELELADLDGFPTRLLLWAAGPYELVDGWLILSPARKTVKATSSLLNELTEHGPVPLSEAESRLVAMGFIGSQAVSWIVSLGGFRVYDDSLVPWRGSIGDKAATVLALAGSPLHQDELFERLGAGRSVRSMVNQLLSDKRFKRTGLRIYGLAHWDNDEYTGIVDEIAQEIERQGGQTSLEHLVNYISATYRVSETSVRAYALGPRFSRTLDGGIELRTASASTRYRKPIEMVRGMFLIDDRWSYRLRVTEQLLSGSGTLIPEAFARSIGLEPLGATSLRRGEAEVRFTWPSLAPNVGSLRLFLEEAGAHVGDHVLLVPSHSDELRVLIVAALQDPAVRNIQSLAVELGLESAADPTTAIGKAVGLNDQGVSVQAIRRRLMARGESDLANLLTDDSIVAGDASEEPLVLSLAKSRFVEVRWSN
jgi:hypothetical protein